MNPVTYFRCKLLGAHEVDHWRLWNAHAFYKGWWQCYGSCRHCGANMTTMRKASKAEVRAWYDTFAPETPDHVVEKWSSDS